MRQDITAKDDKRGPRPPIPFESHKGRLKNLYPKISVPRGKVIAQLRGMSASRQINLGKSHGLNSEYLASTHNKLEVTDDNDKGFFIIKAIKNPELYIIVKPKNLVEEVNKYKYDTEPEDDSDQLPDPGLPDE